MNVRHPSRTGTAPAHRLVVGCGYLGMRVARRWLDAGDRVSATTRRPEHAAALAGEGITPIICDVTGRLAAPPREVLPQLHDCQTVFWAVGFDRAGGVTHHDVHVAGFGSLLDALTGMPRVILASSTGVWGDEDGRVVDERTPPRPDRAAGQALVEAESMLRAHPRGPGVALRFAGLYGPERLPRLAELREGRPIPAAPESWLNLVHVDDAATIVCAVAAAADPAPLYVVSDGRPLRRREWYEHLCAMTDSPPPTWDTTAVRSRSADKRVDPTRVYRELGLSPAYPNALHAIEGLLP